MKNNLANASYVKSTIFAWVTFTFSGDLNSGVTWKVSYVRGEEELNIFTFKIFRWYDELNWMRVWLIKHYNEGRIPLYTN